MNFTLKTQPILAILGLACLLSACTTPSKVNPNPADQTAGCPTPKAVYLPAKNPEKGFYDRFDFHIHNIVADANTIKFQGLNQDFVFCRGNNSWTVQTPTLSSDLRPPQNYEQYQQDILNPPLKTIEFQGKRYQYRVLMEPQFSSGANNGLTRPETSNPADNKVVFELTSPDSQEPQRQTLYTLKDLQERLTKEGYAVFGSQLGLPRITSAVTHGNRIWWSVAFEQGEGNSGIATIIGYDPQTNQFTLIQPPELGSIQITTLAVTGDAANPTFWMGTQLSGEGTAYIPAKGLVAYRPDSQNPNSGSLTSYNVHNSRIVGAIPDKLLAEEDTLWIGTGNGVCQLKWQAADSPESWSCWRYGLSAKLLTEETPLYKASLDETPAVTLTPATAGETIEVLWWSPIDYQTRKGRYEVRYAQPFTVTIDQGMSFLPEEFQKSRSKLTAEQLPFEWPGNDWHWNGQRFVKGFDEVVVDLLSVGPRGIGPQTVQPDRPSNENTIRGDLDLVNLTEKSTSVKYYSGWVDEAALNPYVTIVPQEYPQNVQPNPLKAIKKQ